MTDFKTLYHKNVCKANLAEPSACIWQVYRAVK